jgi:hypothetical protein
LGKYTMRTIRLVLLLFVAACQRYPNYDSQGKLLIRWIIDGEPKNDWPALRAKIVGDGFARSSLNAHPQLAAAISKSEIGIAPESSVVVISVSASTPSASLEGVRILAEAVTQAAHKAPVPFNVAVVQEPALSK